jgi:hypothetical protein
VAEVGVVDESTSGGVVVTHHGCGYGTNVPVQANLLDLAGSSSVTAMLARESSPVFLTT